PGAHISKRQKTTIGLVEQLSRVSGGRGVVWEPGGPFIAPPGTLFKAGVTGSSGIPAYSSGALTGKDVAEAIIVLSSSDPYLAGFTATSKTFVGFNLSSQAVAANTNTLYALFWGLWICIWED